MLSQKLKGILLCISLEEEPGPRFIAAILFLDCFSVVTEFPYFLNYKNYLNLPFWTHGKSRSPKHFSYEQEAPQGSGRSQNTHNHSFWDNIIKALALLLSSKIIVGQFWGIFVLLCHFFTFSPFSVHPSLYLCILVQASSSCSCSGLWLQEKGGAADWSHHGSWERVSHSKVKVSLFIEIHMP